MAPRAASAVLHAMLFFSAQQVESTRKLGAGQKCSAGTHAYVGQVVRLKSVAHNYWLGNGCKSSTSLLEFATNRTNGAYRSRSRGGHRSRSGGSWSCGNYPQLGNFLGHVKAGSWTIVKGEGSTVLLKSCKNGKFLHAKIGHRYMKPFQLSDSTSEGSRWCMAKQDDDVVSFQSARSGRYVRSVGNNKDVVGDDHNSGQSTKWEIDTQRSCPSQ